MYWVLLVACLGAAAIVAYRIEREEENFHRSRQEREWESRDQAHTIND